MNLKKLSVAALAALTLFSCTKEVIVDGSDNNAEGEKTIASIVVGVGENVDTKASYSDYFPGNEATTAERKIYNAIAIAFDNRQLLEQVGVYDNFRTSIDPAEARDGANAVIHFIGDTELTTGYHTFYVLVNVPKSLIERQADLFPKGMTVAQFEKEILTLASVHDIIREHTTRPTEAEYQEETRGFFMSSLDAVGATLLSKDSEDLYDQYGIPNPVRIQVGRVTAKTSLAYLPDENNGEPFGGLTNIQYKVINNPREVYVVPNKLNGTIITPHFYENYHMGNFLTEPAHNYKAAILEDTAEEDMTYTYCVENNNMAPLQGNSTLMKIKAQFVPSEWLDVDGLEGATPTSDGTFWRIKRNHENGDFKEWVTGYYNDANVQVGTNEELVEYSQGICYYNVWLRNNSEYMVKRNTYVKVIVDSVGGAGEPDENGGVDPELPIDEKTQSGIRIYVADWDEVEQVTQL